MLQRSDWLFLVGVFSFKEKSPTITVTSLFCCQVTECMRSGHFLQNYLTTEPAIGNAYVGAKGPSPFHLRHF